MSDILRLIKINEPTEVRLNPFDFRSVGLLKRGKKFNSYSIEAFNRPAVIDVLKTLGVAFEIVDYDGFRPSNKEYFSATGDEMAMIFTLIQFHAATEVVIDISLFNPGVLAEGRLFNSFTLNHSFTRAKVKQICDTANCDYDIFDWDGQKRNIEEIRVETVEEKPVDPENRLTNIEQVKARLAAQRAQKEALQASAPF